MTLVKRPGAVSSLAAFSSPGTKTRLTARLTGDAVSVASFPIIYRIDVFSSVSDGAKRCGNGSRNSVESDDKRVTV